MGSRSKGGHGYGTGGGVLRLLMENAVQSAGAGGIVMTVWTPASELTTKDQEELHTYWWSAGAPASRESRIGALK